METFTDQFNFKRELAFCVGIEREAFIADDEGNIRPWASKVLATIGDSPRFGYELSACQIEDRSGPCRIENVMAELKYNEDILTRVERELNFKRQFNEVGPEDMPLDVYPDPTGRYRIITEKMPREILLAACRVIGTHIHIGMLDQQTALRIYNSVRQFTEDLSQLGDHSHGERLSIYAQVAPDNQPPHYNSWEDFHLKAKANGFDKDPRKCWHLIRISKHGTLEFRMFGATQSIEEIYSWALRCLKLCESAY